jgi:hypothetical protein
VNRLEPLLRINLPVDLVARLTVAAAGPIAIAEMVQRLLLATYAALLVLHVGKYD